MKRQRDIDYSTIVNDDNILHVLKNLDLDSLIKFSLVSRLYRLFSLFLIRKRSITLFPDIANMINRCFFYQRFIILYQQLYISSNEQ